MGRYVSIPIDIPNYLGFRDVAPNFGSCNFKLFTSSGSFCVPKGVDKVRITALGAGGIGGCFCTPCIVGSAQCLLNCSCCCPNATRGMWAGPGGGGGGYVVATVTVTSGCVCCIVVGAAGGGATCFSTAVIAYGGCPGCICCNGCCGCGGLGGSFCVGAAATCLVGYCGNQGRPGYGCVNTFNNGIPGQSGLCIINPWPISCTACGFCCLYCHCSSKVSIDCFAGGASGSFLGGNYIGPWPGALCSDILSGQSVLGTNCIDSCVAAICGITIRWCGEMLLSTYICSIFGCNNVVPAVAACTQTSAPYPWCFWCVSVFGGAAAHCLGADMRSTTTCGICCYSCCCPAAGCTFAICCVCGCDGFAALFCRSLRAGCGGGGAGQWMGFIYYCNCYCNYGYGVCCCFNNSCGTYCNVAGCPGNGYLVIEW